MLKFPRLVIVVLGVFATSLSNTKATRTAAPRFRALAVRLLSVTVRRSAPAVLNKREQRRRARSIASRSRSSDARVRRKGAHAEKGALPENSNHALAGIEVTGERGWFECAKRYSLLRSVKFRESARSSSGEVKRFSVPGDTVVSFELALGFSQAGPSCSSPADIRGRARDPVRVDIRGLTEVPFISPYVGVRTGLLTLQAGRLYKGDTLKKFGGDTFQLGGVVGLVKDMFGVNVFAESSYSRRRFDSVEWDAAPPESLRTMSFTGLAFAFCSVPVRGILASRTLQWAWYRPTCALAPAPALPMTPYPLSSAAH